MCVSPSCWHPWFRRTTSSKLFAWVQCKSTPVNNSHSFRIYMLSINVDLKNEIFENHSEFYVYANSYNKFVSSRSRQIMKLLILLCKGTCVPLSKGRGKCPRSGVPGWRTLHSRHRHPPSWMALPRKARARFNRLRTAVRGVRSCLNKFGMAPSAPC